MIMTDLIKANPHEALSVADRLSPLARQELPLEVAAEVEKLVSARGDLEVLGVTTKGGNSYRRYATIGNDRYAVYTFGSRSAPIPESDAPLLGISLKTAKTIQVDAGEVTASEELLALRPDKFRVLSKAETALIRQNEPSLVQHHCPYPAMRRARITARRLSSVGGAIVWLLQGWSCCPHLFRTRMAKWWPHRRSERPTRAVPERALVRSHPFPPVGRQVASA
jgi:hypothetical protein